MRRLVLAVMMAGVAHGALAADMPDLPVLRGFVNDAPRATRVNWQGVYVGGQGAFSQTESNLTNVNSSVVSAFAANYGPVYAAGGFAMPFFPALGRAQIRGANFGGFVGYNAQWDDAVISLEGNYSRAGITTTSGGRPLFTNVTPATGNGGFLYKHVTTSLASLTINDLGTLRVRGGWAAGCFMPYAFAGLAVGDVDLSRTVTGQVTRVPLSVDPNTRDPNAAPGLPLMTQSSNFSNHLTYGFTMGAGTEVMLFGGIFARAEYEFVRLVSPVETNINTLRAGLGYKF